MCVQSTEGKLLGGILSRRLGDGSNSSVVTARGSCSIGYGIDTLGYLGGVSSVRRILMFTIFETKDGLVVMQSCGRSVD
jgi:hypothetical protein